jgi:hypothetical protein
MNFTPTMAMMHLIMPTMPYQTPYQAIHYMGQQFGPPPPLAHHLPLQHLLREQ